MPRIYPVNKKTATVSVRSALEKQRNISNDPVSNMQATLAHSLSAFNVYMQWDTLFDEVKRILGERQAYIFALSISKGSSCVYCETVFRKRLADTGTDADHLILSDEEKDLSSFGEAVARYHGNIANHLFNSLAKKYFTEELVILTAFAGQMIAANVFNNVTETNIDDHLAEHVVPIKKVWG